ncbi:MAG TPA: tetratricopeptide repeat protein, partial [Polyangia bacterium]
MLSSFSRGWGRLLVLLLALLTPMVGTRSAVVAGPASVLPTTVAEARAELDAGHPEQAARIAERAVVADPENGDAHLVLGLARFRTHRYAEAADAFDAAAHAARPVAATVAAFNKGSALFKAGQFEAAENCFLEAATDKSLAALATVNAAFAALNSEQLDRAKELLSAAQRQPRAREISNVLDDLRQQIEDEEDRLADARVRKLRDEARQALNHGKWGQAITGYLAALGQARRLERSNAELGELTYALGIAQYRAGHFEDARRTFNDAATLSPSEGEFHMMAAVSAARLDENAAARRSFEEALRRGLSPENTDLIRGYLAALAPGLATRGGGVDISAAVATGYDSNVTQSGVGRTETIANTGASAFAEAAFDLAWRFPVGERGFAELAYDFDQTAFFDSELDAFSLQQHTVEATGEVRLLPWLRASLLGGGDMLFAGLSGFAAFQIGATVRPMLAFDEGPRTSTRIELEHSWKHTLQSDFSHLSGTRTDLTIAQDLGSRSVRLMLAYRYRDENLPTPERINTADLPNLGDLPQCPNNSCTYVIPYGYTAHAGLARAAIALPDLGRLLLTASLESRQYGTNSYIEIAAGGMSIGNIYPRERHDTRYGAGIALVLSHGTVYDATVRYDLLISRSNIERGFGGEQHQFDPADRSFDKQVFWLGTAAS